MATRLCLIRHGETAWTREKRLQGQFDIELAEDGFERIRTLGSHLRDWKFDHVISSDLARCTMTSRLLGFEAFETSSEWREVDAGKWSGQLFDEVEADLPGGLANWAKGLVAPPDGESQKAFVTRLSRALHSSVFPRDGVVLVVSHAAAIREVVKLLLNFKGYMLENPDPASMTVLDLQPVPRLRMFNVQMPLSVPEPALATV